MLYGSRVQGNLRPGSDIGFTPCGAGLGFYLLADIASELDDLLSSLIAMLETQAQWLRTASVF